MLLDEQRRSREERTRKSLIYRQMLDEQVRYKNEAIRLDQTHKHYSTPQHKNKPDIYYPAPQKHQNYRNQLMKTEANENRYLRSGQEADDPEERAEKHLKACEEILFNLRELKEKQRMKEIKPIEASPKSDSNHHLKPNDSNLLIQNMSKKFPKNNNFSSMFPPKEAGSRVITSKGALKGKTKDYKTIEGVQHIDKRNSQERLKKSLRVTPGKTQRNPQSKTKRSQNKVESSRTNVHQSSHPAGLKNEYSPRRKSQNPAQKSNKPKLGVQGRDSEKERELAHLKQELSSCLIEMTKYIHAKKEMEREEQEKRSQRVDEEVQAGPSEYELQKQRESRMHGLKLKALIKLRKIKEQSRDLVAKVETQDPARESALKKTKLDQSKGRLSSQFEFQLQKQKIQLKEVSSSQFPQVQPSRASKVPSTLLIYTKPGQTSTEDQSDNSELVRTVIDHMNRQQEQNEELVCCIKELSHYLNNQNQEIQSLKNSRQKSVSGNKRKSIDKVQKKRGVKSSIEKDQLVRYEQYPKTLTKKSPPLQPKPEQGHSREQELKLQQAFLRRLKKARVRGSLLTEKIFSHKKGGNPSPSHSQEKKFPNPPEDID